MPTSLPPSRQSNPNLVPSGRVGSISGARWRGPRGSAPLLAALESALADILTLGRGAVSVNPFRGKSPLLPNATVIGIYQTNTADPSVNIYVDAINHLAPEVFQVHATNLQSLRAQCLFRLTN